jgi:quercetin dioxygenase-like cupin family protein
VKKPGFIKMISSADAGQKSVIELNVLPGEKTPWHYHTLFSETFEVLKGTLKVGKGHNTFHLIKGDTATIEPNEKHFYHNISREECIITVTLDPGNKNFEDSLFILKGLAEDGLASEAGTPRKFTDLVLFVYLSNSRMVGFQKIAEPIFNFFAKAAIRNGQLNELIQRYRKQ